jgi:hypothetical protein
LALLTAEANVRGQSMTETAREIIERLLTFSVEPEERTEMT